MVVIKKTTRVGEDVEKGKPHALLVGVQTGASTMVNSVEVLQNIYKGATTQSSNFTSGYLKKTKVKKKYALPCCWVALQSLSHIQLFVTSWTAAHQASLAITSSQNLLKLMSIELVMPSNHLIFCCPLLFLPSIFPSIMVFPHE